MRTFAAETNNTARMKYLDPKADLTFKKILLTSPSR